MFRVLLGTDYFGSGYFAAGSTAEFVIVPSAFHYFGSGYFGTDYYKSGLFMQPTATQIILRPTTAENLNGSVDDWQTTENNYWDAVNESVLDRNDYIYTTNKVGEANVIRFKFDMSSTPPAPNTDLVFRVDIGGTVGRDFWLVIVCDSVVLHNQVYPLSGSDETIEVTIPYSTWQTVSDWSFFQIQFLGIN